MPVLLNPTTAICSVIVTRKDTGALIDPNVSMNITIYKPDGTAVVTTQAMTRDSTGNYHYDYNPVAGVYGNYRVVYTATNGTRISTVEDNFDWVQG